MTLFLFSDLSTITQHQ